MLSCGITTTPDAYPSDPLQCSVHTIWWRWPFLNPKAIVWVWYPNRMHIEGGEWDSEHYNSQEEANVIYSMRRAQGYRCYIEWLDQDNWTQTYYPWGYSYPADPNFWVGNRLRVSERDNDDGTIGYHL